MNKQFINKAILLAGTIIILVACATVDKTEAVLPEPAVMVPSQEVDPGISYARNIQPIMVASCAPCHYPEKGKKELLDTYDATARFIDDIIYRIQLPPDSLEFMPFKSKKMPLTLDEIQLFIDWRDAGMPD